VLTADRALLLPQFSVLTADRALPIPHFLKGG
jgi:hypothetical protein